MNNRISFRDPSGHVLISDERVFRKVNASGIKDIEAFLSSPAARQFTESKRIIGTQIADSSQLADIAPETFYFDAVLLLEHEKVFFPSYPSEWVPEMLHAAAGLTIDLAELFLTEGMGLKDATPYNILFQGPHPVFVDILSIERREIKDHIWLPLAQFERTFLLPLFVNRRFGVTLDQIFLAYREGIEPEKVYQLCTPMQLFSPNIFTRITLPVWFSKYKTSANDTLYTTRYSNNSDKARFILGYNFKRLRNLLKQWAPQKGNVSSIWSDYETINSYSKADYDAKSTFVEDIVREYAPHSVLDVGCNTGRFSKIAARNGAKVVAIDIDPVVVGRLWHDARRENLDIQPLVVNLAHPTPATGWCNKETLSFLDRAKGAFEAVFMLAIVHHLLVTERIPLREILSLAAGITNNILVIEFIESDDPKFMLICKGRKDLYKWYTKDVFEQATAEFFTIMRSVELEGKRRWLYLLKKKNI